MTTRYKERRKSSTLVGTKISSSPVDGVPPTIDTQFREKPSLEQVWDATSPRPYVDPNPFTSRKRKVGYAVLNGVLQEKIFNINGSKHNYTNYPVSALVPHAGINLLSPLNGYAAIAADRSNPSRPDILSGEAVVGLKELPRTILSMRDAVKNLPSLISGRTLGNLYLSNEFGLKPLIDDVQSLLGLQASIASDYSEFHRASSGKSRRVKLHREFDQFTTRKFTGSGFFLIPYGELKTYSENVWATVRYHKPKSNPVGSLRERASTALGFDLPLSTAWELIPWSFLIDYFVDFGTFIRNAESLSLEVKDICVMRHTISTAKVVSSSKLVATGLWTAEGNLRVNGSGKSSLESKTRAVFRSANFVPFKFRLSGKQLANIGALALSRYSPF